MSYFGLEAIRLTEDNLRWAEAIRFMNHPKAQETLLQILGLLHDKYKKDEHELGSRDTASWLRLSCIHDVIEWDDWKDYKECTEYKLRSGVDCLVICGLADAAYFMSNNTYRITQKGMVVLNNGQKITMPSQINVEKAKQIWDEQFPKSYKCRNIPEITMIDLDCCVDPDWIIVKTNGFWVDIKCESCSKYIEGWIPSIARDAIDAVINNTNVKKSINREDL